MFRITIEHVESGGTEVVEAQLALIMAATPDGQCMGHIYNDDPKQARLLPQLAYNGPIAVNDYIQRGMTPVPQGQQPEEKPADQPSDKVAAADSAE